MAMCSRRLIALIALGILSLVASISTQAVSFDCNQASNPAEQSICSSATLGARDDSLAKAYRDALAAIPPAERARLARDQRTWLNEIRDQCLDVACLTEAYTTRQLQLEALQQAKPGAIRQVVLGDGHSCSLDANGAVWCRGNNEAGQVGNGKPGANVTRPVMIIARGVKALSAASEHTCALASGALWCWGDNYYGQIGNGKAEGFVSRPTKIISRDVVAVSVGENQTCAVIKDALYCWGDNEVGQLGKGTTGDGVARPVLVIDRGVSDVSSGGRHVCAIVKGAPYCWGYNYNGQVGNGTSRNSVATPTRVPLDSVTAVSVGDDHTCAISKGALYCWGDNGDFEIGVDGRRDDELRPVKVIGGGVDAVSAGSHHTCAILGDALKCWGSNIHGEAGDIPVNRHVRTPTQVIESGVTAVSAGGQHTCAVVKGAQQCWRYSGYGEIDSQPPRAATFVRSKPQPKVAGLDKFIGAFKGALITNGTEFVITQFRYNTAAELVGEFTVIPYKGSKEPQSTGTLGPCKALPDSEFLCRVQHQYLGNGFLAIQFDAEGNEFRGDWRAGDSFPSMKRPYWLGVTTWNGFRQQ